MGSRSTKNDSTNEDKEEVEKTEAKNDEEERKKVIAIEKDKEPASVVKNQQEEKENRRTEDMERVEKNNKRYGSRRGLKRNRGGRHLEQRNALYGRPRYDAGYRGSSSFPPHCSVPNDFSANMPPGYPRFVYPTDHSRQYFSQDQGQIVRYCCCYSHNRRFHDEYRVCGCPHHQ